MKILIFAIAVYFSTSKTGNCDGDSIEIGKFKVSAVIDFDRKKIWFSTSSKDQIFISLSGSSINLDALLSDNPEDMSIRPYDVQNGSEWLMAISRGKPNSAGGVEITNFDLTRKRFVKSGYMEISAPTYKLSDKMVLSGPFILSDRIRVIEAKAGDLDESRLLLIPLEP